MRVESARCCQAPVSGVDKLQSLKRTWEDVETLGGYSMVKIELVSAEID